MQPHKIVSRQQWIEARRVHLAQEKELTQARERLSEERRALPWVKVDKAYLFDGAEGKKTLADLFNSKSQLVVQHFMFAPEWNEGCKSCSFWADGFERMIPHLAARDTTLAAVSRAPLSKLLPFKTRMGWTFDWVSSADSDFNYDYAVSFTPDDVKSGAKVYNFGTLEDYVETHAKETLTLSCVRAGQPLEIKVKPEVPVSPPDQKASLGILSLEDKWTLRHPGAIEQVNSSVTAMLETFGALFARHSDIKPQHLGGAVKIMDVYYRLFNSEQGWRLAIWFSVLMNVNLALLNMLPIPVLDGGHILLAIIEGIRRRPISARIISGIQTGCAVLLIGFMVYIAFYDVQDLPWKRSKEKAIELKFAPKAPERP